MKNQTSDEIMQTKAETKERAKESKVSEIVNIALKGVALAMGLAVAVLSLIDKIGTSEAVSMLGIGLACMAITQFSKKDMV